MKRPQFFPRTVGLFGVLLLLMAAFVFGKVQGGFVPWFLFYAFLTIALYEVIVFICVLRGVEVERELSHVRLNAGAMLEVRVKLRRPPYFPVPWMWVEDHVPVTLNAPSQAGAKLLFPWFKREMTYSYECDQLQRGRHKWQRITIQSGDIFGFIQREKYVDVIDEVLVYPKVREIPKWHTLNERNPGASYALNRVSEDRTSVIGVRDYMHGDRLSQIHWKATAKGMGLKTKEFELQTSNDFMFFLDRRTLHYGMERHPLFERAVSLTASLSRYALNRRFTAGLVSYGKDRYVLPPARHPDTLITIYEHLAEVRADSPFPFHKTLLREAVYVPNGTTVVCVTPQVDADVAGAVSQLHERRIKVEVFWLSPTQDDSRIELSRLRSLEQLGIPVRRVYDDRFEAIVRGGGVTSA